MKWEDFYAYLRGRGFEEREAQKKMMALVDQLLREGGVKLVEAPTGTGKTFAYLVPLITSGKKAVVSTGTKVLQDQLRRDLEFLSAHWEVLTGKKVRYAVLKGMSNYLCLDRLYGDGVSPKEKKRVEELLEEGWEGDLSLSPLPPELSSKLSVDEDHCTPAYRKLCPYKDECVYWSGVKLKELSADLLVVNHALLALKDLSSPRRFLVIDEAHELDRYLTLGATFGTSLYALEELKKGLEKLLGKSLSLNAREFFEGLAPLLDEESEVPLEEPDLHAGRMEKLLLSPLRSALQELKLKVRERVRSFLKERLMVSHSFKEFLEESLTVSSRELEEVRAGYEEPTKEEKDLVELIKKVSYYGKKLKRLTALKELMEKGEEEVGFKLSRRFSVRMQAFNYRLEAFPVFPRGILEAEAFKGVLVTSATVDPVDLEETVGLKGQYYRLPYNYDYSSSQFVVENTNPKREDWEEKLKLSFWQLRSTYDKVLVLLTNKEHLKLFEGEEETALQGGESLTNLINYLREGKVKALVGLDSLWTGVDVKGKKGILMSKLPFESPKEPLTYFRLKYLKKKGISPFDYQRRKAFIKFRQGVGRLVRSREDGGTVVLCDDRLFRYPEFEAFLREIGIKVLRKGKFYRRSFMI